MSFWKQPFLGEVKLQQQGDRDIQAWNPKRRNNYGVGEGGWEGMYIRQKNLKL